MLKKVLAEGKTAELLTSYDNSDQISGYSLTVYNDGNKEKIYSYDKNKKLGAYITYEYDDGNITKEFEYSPSDDKLRNTIYNKYDEQNRLVEFFDEYAGTQEYIYTTVCEYDMNNNLIKTVEYQDEITNTNLYGYSDYEYEDNQLMIVKTYLYDFENKKGILRWYYENEYDVEGRVNKRCFIIIKANLQIII